jgi:hypothetical protein
MEELGEILRGMGPAFGVLVLALPMVLGAILILATLPRLLLRRT